MDNGEFKPELSQQQPGLIEYHLSPISQVDSLTKEVSALKVNENVLKIKCYSIECQLVRQKERCSALLQELEDLNLLNRKLREHQQLDNSRQKERHQLILGETRQSLMEEMADRLGQKDTLIKEIRLNNQQSEDFLRKRVLSYEAQYKQLEDNYFQLKNLFDQYQTKAQKEKSQWVDRNKSLRGQLDLQKKQIKSTKMHQDSLSREYNCLLQKSAKSEKRLSKIGDDIQQITRQYTGRVLNDKSSYHPGDQISTQKNSHKSYDSLSRRPGAVAYSLSQTKQTYESNHQVPTKYFESTRQSPFGSSAISNNKQNQSIVSNAQKVTNFAQVVKYEVQSRMGMNVGSAQPSSDRTQTHKKKSLEHLIINSQRESMRPGPLEVETPCFQDKVRFDMDHEVKPKKISLRLRRS